MLYIVATPIGNLEDITFRAVRILKEVDIIVCEDTRHTKILLNKYEIAKPLLSYHSHSGQSKVKKVIDLLKEEKDIALVSDAGTPGISDPGYVVIKTAVEEKIDVVPIPGCVASLTALMASGLPINRFCYLGFLPVKKGRQTMFNQLKEEKETVVFYESPYRIQKTINELKEYLGDERKVVIARELTKKFERIHRGRLYHLSEEFEDMTIKGEVTIVIAPPDIPEKPAMDIGGPDMMPLPPNKKKYNR